MNFSLFSFPILTRISGILACGILSFVIVPLEGYSKTFTYHALGIHEVSTGVLADSPKKSARLIVEDFGHFFSLPGVQKAKKILSEVKLPEVQEVYCKTIPELPADLKMEYSKIDENDRAAKSRFWSKYVKSQLEVDSPTGIYFVICRNPAHIHILVSKATRNRGIKEEQEDKIREIFTSKFKKLKEKPEAEQITLGDQALTELCEYVSKKVK